MTFFINIHQKQRVGYGSNTEKVLHAIKEIWKVIFKAFQKTDISCCNIPRSLELNLQCLCLEHLPKRRECFQLW